MKKNANPKAARRGRPRLGDVNLRWEHILDVTVAVFLRDGYAGASIAKIAREGGISKKTIYTKYKDKSELAAKVLEHLFEKTWAHVAAVADNEQRGLAAILTDFATTLGQGVTTPEGLGLYRILIAENPRAQNLSALYWNVRRVHWDDRVSRVLQTFMDRGELRQADPIRLARSFYQLSVSELRERALLGQAIGKALIRKTACMAVEIILTAYAANKAA